MNNENFKTSRRRLVTGVLLLGLMGCHNNDNRQPEVELHQPTSVSPEFTDAEVQFQNQITNRTLITTTRLLEIVESSIVINEDRGRRINKPLGSASCGSGTGIDITYDESNSSIRIGFNNFCYKSESKIAALNGQFTFTVPGYDPNLSNNNVLTVDAVKKMLFTLPNMAVTGIDIVIIPNQASSLDSKTITYKLDFDRINGVCSQSKPGEDHGSTEIRNCSRQFNNGERFNSDELLATYYQLFARIDATLK